MQEGNSLEVPLIDAQQSTQHNQESSVQENQQSCYQKFEHAGRSCYQKGRACWVRTYCQICCVLPLLIIIFYFRSVKNDLKWKPIEFQLEDGIPIQIPSTKRKILIQFRNSKIFYDVKDKDINSSKIYLMNSSKIYLKIAVVPEEGSKKPRGFLFKSPNATFWTNYVNLDIKDLNGSQHCNSTKGVPGNCNITQSKLVFKSYTYRRVEPELWFTNQQIHDQGAVKDGFQYILPKAVTLFGYTKNKLVNRDRQSQDERGIKLVEIDAKNYKSDYPLNLYVVQQQQIFDYWWINFIAWQIVMGCLYVIDNLFVNKLLHSISIDKLLRRVLIIYNIFYKRFGSLYKDFFFFLYYWHLNPYTETLALFIILYPYWLFWAFSFGSWHKIKVIVSQYLTRYSWSNRISFVREDVYKILVFNFPRDFLVFCILYYEQLYIGSYWSSYMAIIPIISVYGILTNYSKGLKQVYQTHKKSIKCNGRTIFVFFLITIPVQFLFGWAIFTFRDFFVWSQPIANDFRLIQAPESKTWTLIWLIPIIYLIRLIQQYWTCRSQKEREFKIALHRCPKEHKLTKNLYQNKKLDCHRNRHHDCEFDYDFITWYCQKCEENKDEELFQLCQKCMDYCETSQKENVIKYYHSFNKKREDRYKIYQKRCPLGHQLKFQKKKVYQKACCDHMFCSDPVKNADGNNWHCYKCLYYDICQPCMKNIQLEFQAEVIQIGNGNCPRYHAGIKKQKTIQAQKFEHNNEDNAFECSRCNEECAGNIARYCQKCNFKLCKECLEFCLKAKEQHAGHTFEKLKLQKNDFFNCNKCKKDKYTGVQCLNCKENTIKKFEYKICTKCDKARLRKVRKTTQKIERDLLMMQHEKSINKLLKTDHYSHKFALCDQNEKNHCTQCVERLGESAKIHGQAIYYCQTCKHDNPMSKLFKLCKNCREIKKEQLKKIVTGQSYIEKEPSSPDKLVQKSSKQLELNTIMSVPDEELVMSDRDEE